MWENAPLLAGGGGGWGSSKLIKPVSCSFWCKMVSITDIDACLVINVLGCA